MIMVLVQPEGLIESRLCKKWFLSLPSADNHCKAVLVHFGLHLLILPRINQGWRLIHLFIVISISILKPVPLLLILLTVIAIVPIRLVSILIVHSLNPHSLLPF